MSAPLDLCEWLGAATRGLPRRLKPALYDELTAHYDDALTDALTAGLGFDAAHRQALAQLGDPHLTAAALRDTHLARRRRALAMGAAIASLLWVVVGALMAGSTLLYSLFAFAICSVVLRSFQNLLTSGIAAPPLRFPVAWIEVGTLLVIALGTIGNFSGGLYPTALVLTDPLIVGRSTLWMQDLTPIHVLMSVAIGGVGVGWVMLSERLIEYQEQLHGLTPLLRAVMLVGGLGLIAAGAALFLRNADALNMVIITAASLGFARQALLALLFFRAAFSGRRTPQSRGLS